MDATIQSAMDDQRTRIRASGTNFFLMRHGESIPNTKGIIVSDPIKGLDPSNGLSDRGKLQVAESADRWLAEHSAELQSQQKHKVAIYASVFSRAKETAEILKRQIDAKLDVSVPLVMTQRLIERYFGEFDGGSNTHYEDVWRGDPTNPHHHNYRCESACEVSERAMAVLEQAAATHAHHFVILVSHGDVLQILQATCAGLHPGMHRSLPHLNTAEIRSVQLR